MASSERLPVATMIRFGLVLAACGLVTGLIGLLAGSRTEGSGPDPEAAYLERIAAQRLGVLRDLRYSLALVPIGLCIAAAGAVVWLLG